jgi:hypothetical protein
MRKTRVKWLKKHFGDKLDAEDPKHDFRLVKKWWAKLSTPARQDLVKRTSLIKIVDTKKE